MQSTPSNAQYSLKKVESYRSRTNTISNMYKVNAMLNFSAKLANEISEIDVRQFWLKLIFCSNKMNGQTCTTYFDAVEIEMSFAEKQILVALLIYFKIHFIFREFPWIFRVVIISGTAIRMANGKMNADNCGAHIFMQRNCVVHVFNLLDTKPFIETRFTCSFHLYVRLTSIK